MSLLNNILSSIDPTAKPQSPAPGSKQSQPGGLPKPTSRPGSTVNGANGTSQNQALKRKAEGQPDGGQVKIQRSGTIPSSRPNGAGASRPPPTPDAVKAKAPASANPLPYRGTAGTGGSTAVKPLSSTVKKPVSTTSASTAPPKSTTPVPKGSGGTPAPGAAPIAAKKGSYAAMLQAAKEKEKIKPAAPPVKHEVTKILTKKERLALREQMKGKKPGLTSQANPTPQAGPAKAGNPKGDGKEKRKPAELGYTGTARPAKKPVDLGYKGTARPSPTIAGPAGKSTATAAKSNPKKPQGRYDGYKDWSDLEDEDDEEEEPDYDSDASSDMEGGIWDVEQEEQLALRAAKVEDAKALAEENELKRQKEERKRKLAALNKAAAGKRKY